MAGNMDKSCGLAHNQTSVYGSDAVDPVCARVGIGGQNFGLGSVVCRQDRGFPRFREEVEAVSGSNRRTPAGTGKTVFPASFACFQRQAERDAGAIDEIHHVTINQGRPERRGDL